MAGMSMGCSADLARVSARRPLLTVGIWLALAAGGIVLILNLLDSASTTELSLTGGAESSVAGRLVADRLGQSEPVI